MKTSTILLGVLLVFIACQPEFEKEKIPVTTKVHGHLMVLGTGEVINDRPYKMVLRHFSTHEVYDETYTDENGYYEFTHDAYRYKSHGGTDYEYEIVLGEEVPDETFTGAMPLFLDTLDEFAHVNRSWRGYKGRGIFSAGYQSWANVALEKKAWLELEVENIDPQIGDEIRIHYVHYRGEGLEWMYTFHHGQHWKIILPGVGNYENLIQYTVKVGDEYVGMEERVLLGEMDTTYFKLEY